MFAAAGFCAHSQEVTCLGYGVSRSLSCLQTVHEVCQHSLGPRGVGLVLGFISCPLLMEDTHQKDTTWVGLPLLLPLLLQEPLGCLAD